MPGTLVICATPIGNLGDVSERLASTLGAADVVYAEDTRRTATLLSHLGITVPLRSYFAGNEASRAEEVGRHLEAGELVALVTDAGTPVVSDPGASAVAIAVDVGAKVTVVPGPSAVTSALAISGFDGDRFVFAGFLPRRGRARQVEIDRIAGDDRTVVLFAAPSRVADDLAALAHGIGSDRRLVVARELTKLHEEVWRGTLGAAASEFAEQGRARGEFTIVIEGAPTPEPDMDAAIDAATAAMAGGATMSDAVRDAASRFGVSRRELYDRVLRSGP